MARSTLSARDAAEAAFRKATTKPVEGPSPEGASARPAVRPAVPGSRESVTLRIDSAVLEHFQAEGPGWQDRINAALRRAAGLA